MAYKAPVSPGTESEGNWYVPVIGMGTGSIIGNGMQSLKDQWAHTLSLFEGRAALPTAENLTSLAGGTHLGRASTNVPSRIQEGRDFEKLHQPIDEALGLSKSYMEDPNMMGVSAKSLARITDVYGPSGKVKLATGHTPRQRTEFAGGMIPDKDVLDRVMNSGLRDKILGFGNKP